VVAVPGDHPVADGGTLTLGVTAADVTYDVTYAANDILNFTSANTANTTNTRNTIDIGAGAGDIAGLYVSGTQSFDVIGTGGAGGLAVTGTLVLGYFATDASTFTPLAFTGTLDLAGINGAGINGAGANTFAGGIEINTGALRVLSTAQLGIPNPGGLAFTGTGALIVADGGNLAFDDNYAGTPRLVIGTAATIVSATIIAAPGAIFSINRSASGASATSGSSGGAMEVGPGSTLVLTGTAAGAGGGFLFESNTAALRGGAIFSDTASTVIIDSATFNRNTAAPRDTANGGAIETEGGTVIVRDSVFSDNTTVQPAGNSTTNGGAIAGRYGAVIDVADVLFTSNTAHTNGGALFNNHGDAMTTVASSTFASNTATMLGGGAICILGDGGAVNRFLTVTDALFTDNSASRGGAIQVSAYAQTLITSATFLDNRATAAGTAGNFTGGGAIVSIGAGGTITVNDSLFKGNSSLFTTGNSGNGGAITIDAASTLIVNSSTFDGNSADTNGGAIHTGGANSVLTLTDVSFLNNTASSGNGGAISINAGGPVTYNVTTGTSRIAGNTAGGIASSIYAANNGSPRITFNISGAASLDMLDPIGSGIANNQLFAITKDGAGILKLGGAHVMAPLNPNAAASGTVAFTVATGTLHLYRAGELSGAHVATAGSLTLTGTKSAFTLGAGAVLSAGGGNTINAGKITLDATSTLALDLAGAVAIATDPAASILTFTSTGAGALLTANDWTQSLSLLNIDTLAPTITNGDTFALITLTGAAGTFTAGNLASLTANLVTPLTNGYNLQLSDDLATLQLYYYLTNSVLTWTGAADTADGSWPGANWKTAHLATATFTQGDIVNLDSSAPAAALLPPAAPITIDIAPAALTTATIAGLYVSGSRSHTLTGASIEADAAAYTAPIDSPAPAAATGKLILGARATDDAAGIDTAAAFTGTLTLANASNTFQGGIEINTGALAGNALTLGAGPAGITIGPAGKLIFDQAAANDDDDANDAVYAAPIAGSGALVKTNTGALTLAANSSAFTGTTNVAAGSLILAPAAALGGQINVNLAALLGGSGTATGDVTINAGGTLAPSSMLAPSATLFIDGTLTLNPGSTLLYNLVAGNQSDLITAAALDITTLTANSATIALNAATAGSYRILDSAAGIAASATSAIATTLAGGETLPGRSAAAYTIAGNSLLLEIFTANAALTWTGTTSLVWDNSSSTVNWNNTTTAAPATTADYFLAGDHVTFNDTAAPAASRTVTIGAAILAAGMTVDTAGAYAFAGSAGITTGTAGTNLPGATGALTKLGSGTLDFTAQTGPNNFTEGIDLRAGGIIGAADTLGAGPAGITTAADTTLTFAQPADATYAGNITGAGDLVKTGDGNLTLAGVTTHTGSTTIATGTLTLANAGQLASSAAVTVDGFLAATAAQTLNNLTGSGTLSNSALTTLHSTRDTTFAGVIADAGGVTTTGSALTLTGNHTFAGPLTIDGATSLGDGSAADGAVAGAIVVNGKLILNHGATNDTLTNTLSGPGLIEKRGSGALTLAAANAATFTGTTDIAAGSLILAPAAALGGRINVHPAALLGGSGTATGDVTINTGGTLAPSTTLSIGGTLTLNPGSTLLYNLAAGNQSDLITAAALVRYGAGAIDVNTSLSGTYTLITTAAASDATAAASLATTVNGGAFSGRTQAAYEIVAASDAGGGSSLNLVIFSGNLAGVTWDGANGSTWQDNHANWKTDDQKFLDGDSVIFDDTRSGTNLVTVAPAGVRAVDMLVNTTGIYAFNGGVITISNTLNSAVAPAASGALTIAGPGLVYLNNDANLFEGGITILDGALRGNALTLATGPAAGIVNHATLVFDQAADATYASPITGTGALEKRNTGALTLTNPASAYTGGITVAAGALELQNSGPATQGALTIAPAATLRITAASDYAIRHPLAGAGLLAINTAGSALTFTPSSLLPHSPAPSSPAPSFSGTLALESATLHLGGDNTAALAAATLQTRPGSTVTIATGTQTIAALALDGGTLIFTATIPGAPEAAGIIAANTLALNSGSVQITLAAAPSVSSTAAGFFAQAAGTTLTRLVTAATVTGDAASLTLVDQTGSPVGATQTAAITQNGLTVATATHGYKLDATGGLNVNHALTSLTLLDNHTLTLAPAAGDTGAFNARISGSGNLAIDASRAPVTLGAANDFTGTTTVTAGALVSGNNGALGDPANTLVLAATATFDLNGHTQTLATLNTAPTATIALSGGALTLSDGGVIDGSLTGSGTLHFAGGALALNGDHLALDDTALIATHATATLTLATAATGTLAAALAGPGALNLTGPGSLTLARASDAFTGRTNIDAGAAITATDPAALGTGPVNIGATATLTYATATATDSVITNDIAGPGALNLDGPSLTLSGSNTIARINALPGANIRATTAAALGNANTTLTLTAATVTLAHPNTTLGHVRMDAASILAFAPGHPPGATATLASLASTGATAATLVFNTDIGAPIPATDTLVLAAPASGAFNIVLNNTGSAPAPGTDTINLAPIQGAAATAATWLGGGTLTFSDSMEIFRYRIAPSGDGTLAIQRGPDLGPTGAAIIANATAAMPLTWFAELDTLAARLGDLRLAPRANPGMHLWLRAHAQRINVNDKDTLVPFREDQYGAEAGLDYAWRPAAHAAALCIGAFLGSGASNRDIENMNATGDTTSNHGGLYATLTTPAGWYADIVGKYNHFKNTFNATSGNGPMSARYNTQAIGGSIEAGRRIELGGNWHVTPGAQAAATRIASARYTTDPSTNLTVHQAATTGSQLRAGAQAGYKGIMRNGRTFQPRAKLHLAQQWTTGGAVCVTDDPHGPYYPAIKGIRLEAGLGVDWMATETLQIHFDYECAWAKDYRKPYGVNLAASYAW
jgi:outer membrane autotransporter protein